MPRNAITLVWVAGIVLALFVYVTGPDRFVVAAFEVVQNAWWAMQEALRNISIAAFDLVRALTIGLFFVFLALCILAIRQDGRGRGALVVVSLVFFGLVWQSSGDSLFAHTRWMVALLLVALGALTMTRRLTHPEPSPWRPGSLPPRQGP